MIARALFAGFAALFWASGAIGAEITTGHEGQCQTRLTGQITKGDDDRLRQIFTDRGVFEGSVHGEKLCLDSRGGNIAEGLRIGRTLYQLGIPTRLEAGATCLSSCAIAFMMGNLYGDHDPGDGHNADRRMHHSATLGFHRPELSASIAQRSDSALLGQAFDLAIEATLEFVAMSNFSSYRETMIPSDLIQQMFAHQGQDFFYIDTTGKAGRWHIGIDGVTWPLQVPKSSALLACDNLGQWQSAYVPRAGDLEEAGRQVDILTRASGDPVFAVLGSYLTDDGGNECLIRVTEGYDDITGEGPIPVLEACGIFPSDEREIGRGGCDLSAADPNGERWRSPLQSVAPRFNMLATLHPKTPLKGLQASIDAMAREGVALAKARVSPVASLRNRCSNLGLSAEIRGVQNFTNLRARPGLDADTVGQANLGERVRPVSSKAHLWQADPEGDCATMCNFSATELFHLVGSNDPAALSQCFEDNHFWYEVTTEDGQSGFVSGKFLKY